MLCLRRRELLSEPGTVVTEITLNHEFLMSSYNTASERALAESALARHGGSGLNVLIGGLGLGYTAAAALASSQSERVEVMELLPQVIDWIDRGLVPLAASLRGDARLQIRQGDVYERLIGPPARRFDLILLDVDHSPDEALGPDSGAAGRFHSAAGLACARRHLADEGILGIWSYAESSRFTDDLRASFADVWVEPVLFHNELVGQDETDWLFFARG